MYEGIYSDVLSLSMKVKLEAIMQERDSLDFRILKFDGKDNERWSSIPLIMEGYINFYINSSFFFDRNVLIFCSKSAAVFFSFVRKNKTFFCALFPVRDDKTWQGLLYCNRISFKNLVLFLFILFLLFIFFP